MSSTLLACILKASHLELKDRELWPSGKKYFSSRAMASWSVSVDCQNGFNLHTWLGAVPKSDASIQHGEWSDHALGAKPNPMIFGRRVLDTSMKSNLDIVPWLVEWHVYALVLGCWYLHTSTRANSFNIQLNLVSRDPMSRVPCCIGQSREGFIVILKSPIHTAGTVGYIAIYTRPAVTTSELYGGGT